MLTEDVQGRIRDAIAVTARSDAQAVATVLRRVSGATPEQLLTATVLMLREQSRQIAELETEVRQVFTDYDCLEKHTADLEEELEELRAKLKPQAIKAEKESTL